MSASDRAQEIMDRAYEAWQAHPETSFDDFGDLWNAAQRVVVPFGNLNQQVENGGFLQWEGNGYAKRDLGYLLHKTSGKGGALGEVHKLLLKFRARSDGRRSWYEVPDDDEDGRETYDDLDSRYYAIDQDQLWREVMELADRMA